MDLRTAEVIQWQPAVSFKQEICAMMYVFGDVPRPSEDTAGLIETVIHNKMTSTLNELDGIRKLREAKTLSLEDVFFLYRNDPVRIKRMLNVLKIKETARSVSTEEGEVPSEPSEIQSESGRYLKGLPQLMQSILELPGGVSVLDIDTRDDVVQQKRNEMADLVTDSMDIEEYISFSKLRKVNYYKDQKKFKDWLHHPVILEPKLPPSVLEAIGHVCYEITREFVEDCLMVKAEGYRDDVPKLLPREQVYQATNEITSYSHMISHTQQQQQQQQHILGIQPSHVNEVLRRQSSGVSMFQPLW